MSQISQSTPSNVTEGYPVTNLTLVVLLLIPCVVILLLLNCVFLGYKLLILSKSSIRHKRQDAEEMLLQSTLQRATRVPALQDGRRVYMSVSEPVLPHPVTSSRASSRERAGADHMIRLLRPDGATGSGSLRAPSTIRATSPAAGFSPRLHLPSGSRTHSVSKVGWCRSAPILPQSSDSEAETRVNLVPPNSPMVSDQQLNQSGTELFTFFYHCRYCQVQMSAIYCRSTTGLLLLPCYWSSLVNMHRTFPRGISYLIYYIGQHLVK